MSHKQISVADLYTLTQSDKDLMILDVRSPEEYKTVRIPHSHNMPINTVSVEKVSSLLDKLNKPSTDPIYVTCASGPRAIRACESLEGNYENVYHIMGCVNAWVAEGFPVEKG